MQKIEILFAGTGNAFNSNGRANQAIVLSGEYFTYCVDAGPTLMYQLNKYKVAPGVIDTLLLTHFHGDHTAGIPFLSLYYREFSRNDSPLTIAGPMGIKKQCEKLYQATYPEIELGKDIRYIEYPVMISKYIRLGSKNFLDIYPMVHSPESLGYKFHLEGKCIAVTGDTKWNENIPLLVEGADVAIIECTTLEKSTYKHLSLAEIEANLHRLDAKTIVPIHLDAEIAKAFKHLKNPKIKLVEDGEKIQL